MAATTYYTTADGVADHDGKVGHGGGYHITGSTVMSTMDTKTVTTAKKHQVATSIKYGVSIYL